MSEAAIVRHIEANCHSGRKVWDVYEDFCDIALATLEAMPRHVASAAATGKPAEDTPEAQELWARLRTTYNAGDFGHFRDAFRAMIDAANERAWNMPDNDSNTWDIVGSAYMQLNVSSNHSGQYFTRWSIAKMSANMTLIGIEQECRARVAAAINAGPWGAMGLADGDSLTQPGKEQIMLMALADAYRYLKPVAVNDPACGSGIMLLAAASCCPRWAIDYAVVRFFGQDIDRTCVKMAQINMMLYGLNGYGLKLNAAALEMRTTVSAPPPPDAVTLPTGRMQQGALL